MPLMGSRLHVGQAVVNFPGVARHQVSAECRNGGEETFLLAGAVAGAELAPR